LAVLCGQLIRAIEGGTLTHEIEATEKELRLRDGVVGVGAAAAEPAALATLPGPVAGADNEGILAGLARGQAGQK
jgi:hypothetical protein